MRLSITLLNYELYRKKKTVDSKGTVNTPEDKNLIGLIAADSSLRKLVRSFNCQKKSRAHSDDSCMVSPLNHEFRGTHAVFEPTLLSSCHSCHFFRIAFDNHLEEGETESIEPERETERPSSLLFSVVI